jgi:hypothetical protein
VLSCIQCALLSSAETVPCQTLAPAHEPAPAGLSGSPSGSLSGSLSGSPSGSLLTDCRKAPMERCLRRAGAGAGGGTPASGGSPAAIDDKLSSKRTDAAHWGSDAACMTAGHFGARVRCCFRSRGCGSTAAGCSPVLDWMIPPTAAQTDGAGWCESRGRQYLVKCTHLQPRR